MLLRIKIPKNKSIEIVEVQAAQDEFVIDIKSNESSSLRTKEEISYDLDNRILEYLNEKEKAGSGEIAKVVGVNRSTVSRHLKYLGGLDEVEELLEKGHSVWSIKEKKEAEKDFDESEEERKELVETKNIGGEDMHGVIAGRNLRAEKIVINDQRGKKEEIKKESSKVLHGVEGNVYANNVNIIENLTLYLGGEKGAVELPSEAAKYNNRAWLIIPKKHSNGVPVSQEQLQSYKDKVYNQFKGWTIIPDTKGIFLSKRTGRPIEDDSLILLVCFPEKDTEEGKEFLRGLAKEIADDLGQESVILMFDRGETEFLEDGDN